MGFSVEGAFMLIHYLNNHINNMYEIYNQASHCPSMMPKWAPWWTSEGALLGAFIESPWHPSGCLVGSVKAPNWTPSPRPTRRPLGHLVWLVKVPNRASLFVSSWRHLRYFDLDQNLDFFVICGLYDVTEVSER